LSPVVMMAPMPALWHVAEAIPPLSGPECGG
jgi:hypothetical protein